MISGFCAVTQAAAWSGRLLRLYLSPRTAHGTGLHQIHRFGPVRHINIRHVIPAKRVDITSDGAASEAAAEKRSSGDQITAPAGQPSLVQTPKLSRDSRQKVVESIDVERWRSSLILPSHTFFDRWTAALREHDAGGLRTAVMFVRRWCNALSEKRFAAVREKDSGAKMTECTAVYDMPIIGPRTVISFGHNKVSMRMPFGCA